MRTGYKGRSHMHMDTLGKLPKYMENPLKSVTRKAEPDVKKDPFK